MNDVKSLWMYKEDVGALVFWELRDDEGGKYVPFQLNLTFKPSRWRLFKFWLLGVKWVDFKKKNVL